MKKRPNHLLLLVAGGLLFFLSHGQVKAQVTFDRHNLDSYFSPFYIVSADLNRDGRPDILAGHRQLAYWQNLGSGKFSKHVIDNDAKALWSIYPVDLDGDGDVDLLAAHAQTGEIAYYKNSSMSFQKIIVDDSFTSAESVAGGDLDGDGRGDIVGINWSPSSSNNPGFVTVWYNDGSNRFSRQDLSTTTWNGHKIKVADLDGDGRLDILGCAASSSGLFWFKNLGGRDFSRRVITTKGGLAVYPADLDHDGDVDVIFSRAGANEILLFFNSGRGSFSEKKVSVSFTEPKYAVPADFNGDGLVDLAVVDDVGLWWLENTGGFNFKKHLIDDSVGVPFSVAAGDFSEDGVDDITTGSKDVLKLWWWETNSGAIPKSITVLSPNGGETLTAGENWEIRWSTTGDINAVRIEFSENNGGSWSTISSNTVNDGSYTWTVPALNSTNCLVRITDAGGSGTSDRSDANFSIFEPKSLRILAPNGGENIGGGTTFKIRWTYEGQIDNVNLYFSPDDGTTWSPIAATSNSGSYEWQTPQIISSQCLVKIEDAVGGASDQSDNTFMISQSAPDSVYDGFLKNVADFYLKSSGSLQNGNWLCSSSGEIRHWFYFPDEKQWQLTLYLQGQFSSSDPPDINLFVDNLPFATVRITNTSDLLAYQFFGKIPAGNHWMTLSFKQEQADQKVVFGKLVFSQQVFSDRNWVEKFVSSVEQVIPDPENYNLNDWKMDVLILGMIDAYKLLSREDILTYIRRFAAPAFDQNGQFTENLKDDWTVAAFILDWLYRETGVQKYRDAVLTVSPSDVQNFPRIENGAFVHQRKLLDQIWVDSIHGLIYYLLGLYDIQKDPYYLRELIFQIKKHAEILQDPSTGLFYHAYDSDGSASWADPATHLSKYFWARGNGWLMMALADLLSDLPPQWDAQDRADLQNIFLHLAEGVKATQDVSGLWYTIMDQPDREGNYLELSASCLFLAGLQKAVHFKILSSAEFGECIAHANEAITRKLYQNPDGILSITDVSSGTSPGSYTEYVSVPLSDGHEYIYGDGVLLSAKSRMDPGYYPPRKYVISGTIQYFSGGQGVPGVQVDVVDIPSVPDTSTDSLGRFALDVQDGVHSLVFSKTPDEDVGNQLTFYDAALAARNAVGLINLSDLQKEAADVSGDSLVTAFDAALIARYAVGFPRLNGTYAGYWHFNPDTLVVHAAGQDTQFVQISAYIRGDVDGSWGNSSLPKKSLISSRDAAIQRYFQIFKSQDSLRLKLTVPGGRNILSFSAIIQFDAQSLQFVRLEPKNLGPEWTVLSHLMGSEIKTGAFGLQPADRKDQGIELVFHLTDEKGGEHLVVQSFTLNGQLVGKNVDTAVQTDRPAGHIPRELRLYPNYPNPFNGLTTIQYSVPGSGFAEIDVFDVTGRRVAVLKKGMVKSGRHDLVWNGKDLEGLKVSSGIYWVRLTFNGKIANILKIIYLQ